MKPEDIKLFQDLLKEKSGLNLGADKAYLLQSRLRPVALKHSLKDVEYIADKIRKRTASRDLILDVVDAMTTNETFWFRDGKPFELFREVVLPRLLTENKDSKRIRIWSAACSNGQEPYSLAMILKDEQARLKDWQIEILATDISKQMIASAKAGEYSQFEVQRGLPFAYLPKFFEKAGDRWKIKADLKQMVTFKEANLLESFAGFGTFDVVFCRNVLIYFDQETKKAVLKKIHDVLRPGGYMFLGGSETALGSGVPFEQLPDHRGVLVAGDKALTRA